VKILNCPVNGPRPVSEFVYAGELRPMPDPATASDVDWAAHVFNRRGVADVKHEWWHHIASGVWFVAERNTATDTVLRTYLYQKPAA